MNPNQKANELVDKYRPYVDCEIAGRDSFVFSREEQTKNAIECALIEVKDLIKEIDDELIDVSDRLGYYTQVETELIKMKP